jgi:hypothetical protein
MSLLATPGESSGAQDSSGNRVAFSLDTFFWRRKRKYLAHGCENPHSNTPSRSDSIFNGTPILLAGLLAG